jgi:predicted nucleotide-binding protein
VGLAAKLGSWTPDNAETVLRQSVGAMLIGLPRWSFPAADRSILMATEYCQYEGAIARAFGLPLLVMVQDDVARRGVFDNSFGAFIAAFPADADAAWLDSSLCAMAVDRWTAQIENRRDIFLGYCGSSAAVAMQIKDFIVNETGASVLDWRTDFRLGRTILDEISEAASRCNAGIFLFTQDDAIYSPSRKRRFWHSMSKVDTLDQAIPRDNVVFETGYFISVKGPNHVLIVLQNGTKMPADLGGTIYTSLATKSDIEPIKDQLRKFVGQL